MKKRILSIVLCLVMVFSLLPFTASAASAIPINEETFPDPVFREYVLKIVGSSVLTEEKARQIEVLDVSWSNIKKVLGKRDPITSLMGIRYLRYVKDLNCSGQELKKTLNLEQNSRVEKLDCRANQLTGLWFHTGSSLKYLNCGGNQFTALNLSKNPELTELYCSGNKITALDLSANKKLQKIVAQANALTTLDTRNLPELTYLDLQANFDLKAIDVSKSTKLEFLNVAQGKLTSLNVSNNRMLVELYVFLNQLTALDVRSNYLLKKLNCYENQLTALDLSSNVALEYLDVSENPIAELDLHPLSNLQKLSCNGMKLKKLDVDRCPGLRELYCYDNQIETLDLRSNKKLEALQCQNNRLSWLNLSSNTALDSARVDCSGNVYDIKVDRNLQYKVYPDLPCYGATEGTYFTAARASDWTGGTVSKVDGWDVLTLDNRDVKEVTYKYDTGNAKIGKVAFTLKTEVPAKYITISFDPNGGTGTMKPMRVKADENYTLPECTFTQPEGREFAGWLAVNGKVYPAGHSVYSTYDQSLKATWKDKEAAEITISFDPNGGSGSMDPVTVDYGTTYLFPENGFTAPEGKRFAHWAIDSLDGDTTAVPGGGLTILQGTTAYAVWEDIPASTGGGGGGGRTSYAVSTGKTGNGTLSLSDTTARRGDTVTVTVKPDKGYTLETLTVTDSRGSALTLTDKGSGKFAFTMPSGSVTVNATFMEDNSILNFFVDVPASAYYYDAVKWAAEQGITGGTDENHFSPDASCTRAQIVTFLWRAAGSPVVNYILPFEDVAESSYYAEAVRWAASQGIVSGVSPTRFGPDLPCTRAQAMTFLYGAMGSPAVTGGSGFLDVDSGAYYAGPVAWAVKNHITSGTGNGLFGTEDPCTRAQIVTFLFGLYQK